MNIMLTSFGIAEAQATNQYSYQSVYYRMPPMRIVSNTFMPDYAALLLCEKVIIDDSTEKTRLRELELVEAGASGDL